MSRMLDLLFRKYLTRLHLRTCLGKRFAIFFSQSASLCWGVWEIYPIWEHAALTGGSWIVDLPPVLIWFHRKERKSHKRRFVSSRSFSSKILLKSLTRRHSKFRGKRTKSREILVGWKLNSNGGQTDLSSTLSKSCRPVEMCQFLKHLNTVWEIGKFLAFLSMVEISTFQNIFKISLTR